jgi:hypothetical protein
MRRASSYKCTTRNRLEGAKGVGGAAAGGAAAAVAVVWRHQKEAPSGPGTTLSRNNNNNRGEGKNAANILLVVRFAWRAPNH